VIGARSQASLEVGQPAPKLQVGCGKNKEYGKLYSIDKRKTEHCSELKADLSL